MTVVESSDAYADAMAFLLDRINYERTAEMPYKRANLKLDRMRRLLHRLGDPHRVTNVIHVAGTKGKGSTCMMLGSVLTAAGFRTGVYTSPHLESVEERFVIDGQVCSSDELVELINDVRPAVDELDHEAVHSDQTGPTYFEIVTAMAFFYFAKRRVDFIVLEVGLGGRLDSTNVCHPMVSVITSISFDHMRQLGGTLAEIATEKAGIVKSRVPVVCGVKQEQALEVIQRIARRQNSAMRNLGVDFDVDYVAPLEISSTSMPRVNYFQIKGGRRVPVYEDVQLGVLGRHQAINSAIAIATCQELQSTGFQIPESAIRIGLRDVRCRARVEVLYWQPLMIVDTAHNVASIDALLTVLSESFAQLTKRLIFATTKGKDITGMLKRLVSHFDDVVCTRYVNNPRCADPLRIQQEIKSIATGMGRTVHISSHDDPRVAFERVWESSRPDDLICITGSFFIAAEMLPLVRHVARREVSRLALPKKGV